MNTEKIKRGFKTACKCFKITLVLVAIAVGAYCLGTYLEKDKWVPMVETLQEQATKVQNVKEGDILQIIKDACDDGGIDWKEAVMTAGCESGFDIYFVGVNKNGTYDRGLFALNNVHYKHINDECAFNPECAAKVYVDAVKNGKQSDFLCALKFGFTK
jgi:hypothetical protein